MKYKFIRAFSCPDAWYKTNNEIWNHGETFVVGYGSQKTETKKLNVSILVTNPEDEPQVDVKAPNDPNYVKTYSLRYLCTPLKEEWETYTYGSRLFEPYNQPEKVIENFSNFKNDRQQTMVIRTPNDLDKRIALKTKKGIEIVEHHPPCLTVIDTEITGDNRLDFTSYFRSWDAYRGLPSNIPGIQMLNHMMVNGINERGREKHKDWEDVRTGELLFHSKNCHIYKDCYGFVEELLSTDSKSYLQKIQEMKKSNADSASQ